MKAKAGFSLVEVLVALGILAVLFTLVGALMGQSLYMTDDVKARTRLHSETMRALQGIVRPLREARQVFFGSEGHELSMVDAQGKVVAFRFDEERQNVYRQEAGKLGNREIGKLETTERPLFAERIEVTECLFGGRPYLVSITLTTRTRLPQRRETVSLTLSTQVHTKA
jgi:prepilin-type N-terminal cleavage/methylation domain-containing protein